MLRLWQDSPNQGWRYLLEDVATCQRYAFINRVDLCTFLQLVTERQSSFVPAELPKPD
jgi:hypothetical protein